MGGGLDLSPSIIASHRESVEARCPSDLISSGLSSLRRKGGEDRESCEARGSD